MAVCFLAIASFTTRKSSTVAKEEGSSLKLSIVDPASGRPTPVRVEVLDAAGKPFVAEDAGYSDRAKAWNGNLDQALALLSQSVQNPYTRTTQFYSTGNSRVVLPPGFYKVKVYKGPEHEVQTWHTSARIKQPCLKPSGVPEDVFRASAMILARTAHRTARYLVQGFQNSLALPSQTGGDGDVSPL